MDVVCRAIPGRIPPALDFLDPDPDPDPDFDFDFDFDFPVFCICGSNSPPAIGRGAI